MKITKENYASEIKKLDVPRMPATLQEGHGFVIDATNGYKSWSAFDDPTLKEVLDLYLVKLNTYSASQNSPKQGKTTPSGGSIQVVKPAHGSLTPRKPTAPMAAPKTKSDCTDAPKAKAVAVAKKEIKQAQAKLANAPASNPAVKAAKVDLKQAQKALDKAKPSPVKSEPKAKAKPGAAPTKPKSDTKSRGRAMVANKANAEKSRQRSGFFGLFRRTQREVEPVNPQAKGKALLREKDKLAKQIHMASPVVKTKTIEYRQISRSEAEKMAWKRLKSAKEAKVKNVRFKK